MIPENAGYKAETMPVPYLRLSNSLSAVDLWFRSLKTLLRAVTKVALLAKSVEPSSLIRGWTQSLVDPLRKTPAIKLLRSSSGNSDALIAYLRP